MSLSRPNEAERKKRENTPDVPSNIIPVEHPVHGPEPKPPSITTPRHSPGQPTKKKEREGGF